MRLHPMHMHVAFCAMTDTTVIRTPVVDASAADTPTAGARPAAAPPADAPPAGSPVTDTRWSPRLWGALVVLCAALFLDALDVSMVGVALPSIGTDLHLSTSALQWVVSGYVLGYGLLLLGGRAADLLGRRRVFLAALAVFAAASLLGGLVDDGGLLIAARFLKG